MAEEWKNRRLQPKPRVRGLDVRRMVPLSAHTRIATVRSKDTPYHYVVQVRTRNRRTGEDVFRTITVAEPERARIDSVLDKAADAVMESPVARREDIVSTRLIDAQRFRP